ncbi:hypothetical protein P3T76_001335 [Phytophthora citrophthora]|uniref:Uncharacterized protein n=1 Tax=Phytophthora citrophthora TaxID=4793 RepID=A0AAD9GZP8_9STRA|nr:hypothetical protein P3T76_001335 [Phytophthora citrophthora]
MDVAAQRQQSRLNQESSQLLRGASEANVLKAAAPVYSTIVAWNDITGETSDSPEPVELETPHGNGGNYEGTVVNDVYVRWDQDECNPCDVPTLAPTLPPPYPHDGDSYEDHLPVVTDEYDSWEDIKEGHTPAPTYASSLGQDEEEDEIVYDGGIRCTKISTVEGGVYQCESPEGYVYCTKVATEYGESYDCHPGTVQPLNTTAPTPAPTDVETLICPNGQQSIGVAGWDHDGCVVSGNVCVSNKFGDCPRGAHCARLGTGVYGCKDGQGCGANEQTIGVVGWDHDGCIVSNNICVAQVKNGDCPAGSYCSLLDSGVYGCVASSTPAPTSPYDGSPMIVCPNGEQRIGVAGWDHDGCVVSGNVCVSNKFGDCPRGAHCARLGTGVYGCKDGQGCGANEQTIGVVGWDHDGCIVSNNICVAQVKNGDCPAGSYCSLLDSGVYGCVASSTPAPTSPYDGSPMIVCPNGEQRIGVAGWDHDGCVVSGNVCVSNKFGDCPRGAHCARLGTGVYGCKDGQGCGANEQTIGVVGWDHDGCIVSNNICVAQVKNGDCPAGSYCSLLDSGVYGCVASSTPAPTSPYDGSPMIVCPNGEQRIGVAGWDHDGCVVSGNVCVSNKFGDCPRGAHCARLGTGVYGCKDGQGCGANEQTIGVVGWDHDGCIVSNNICVAQVKNGDCPAGSYCSLLDSGLYGCVANSNVSGGNTRNGGSPSPTTGTTGGTASAETNGGTTSTGTTGTPTGGAIAGIVIGCAVFVAIVVGAVLSWQKSVARQREENLFADLSGAGGATDYAAM